MTSDSSGAGGTASTSAGLEPKNNLGHRASRGVVVTLGGLWSKTLIQLASTVVLARLLDPSDFGLLAMITAVVGIADLVRDFGMTGAIIQVRKLSDELWSSVLWLSVALGFICMLLIAGAAPLIAGLYGEDRLVVLTLALAPTLLINGICMPLQAKLQRDMKFGSMARIDVVSMATGVVGSIIAALLGAGVWSLIVLSTAALAYRFVALWVASKPRFGRPRISREVLPLLSTGGSLFGVQLLNYAGRNMDNIVVGQFVGAAALGQYSRGYALFLLPLQQLNGPIGRVALPVLSTLQDDPNRYRRYVRGALSVIGYLTLPTFAIASAVSVPLINVVLGDNWDTSAQVFSILAIAGVATGIGNVQGWLYLTLGRTHRQLVFYLWSRPIVVASFFVGVWWNGVLGVAMAYSLVTVVLIIPGFWLAIRGTFVTVSDIVRPVLRPLALVPFMYTLAWGTVAYTALPSALEVIMGGLVGLLPLAFSLLILAYRRDVAEIVSFVKQMKKPRPTVSV